MTEPVADYTNGSQQCLVAVVEHLSRNLLNAQSVADTAAALCPAFQKDAVFRTLWNLEKAGWAVKAGAGYTLSPDLTKLADRLRLTLIETHRKYLEAELS